MRLLQYERTSRYRSHQKFTYDQQAAILDFIQGECSARQAADVVGCTAQGIYVIAVNMLRTWSDDGIVDMNRIATILVNNITTDQQEIVDELMAGEPIADVQARHHKDS